MRQLNVVNGICFLVSVSAGVVVAVLLNYMCHSQIQNSEKLSEM